MKITCELWRKIVKRSLKEQTILIFTFFLLSSSFSVHTDSIEYFEPISEEKIMITSQENSVSDLTEGVENTINEIMDLNMISSLSALTIQKDRISWSKGFGGNTENDSIYNIGSLTKTFTATAILQLYEQGLISLDDSANDYLPFSLFNPFQPEYPITIKMLLLQTSTINEPQESYWNMTRNDLDLKRGISNESLYLYPQWFEEYLTFSGSLYSSSVWTNVTPNYVYIDSNINYDLLGYILEIITDTTLEEYMIEHIFEPLEMFNTKFSYLDYENTSKIAFPYVRSVFFNEIDKYPLYDYLGSGSSGIWSTVLDLSNFMIAHMNSGTFKDYSLLNPETIDFMHDSYYRNWYNAPVWDFTQWTGYGWLQKDINLNTGSWSKSRLFGYEGNQWGYESFMYFIRWSKYADNPYGVVFLHNLDVRILMERRILENIQRLLYEAMFIEANNKSPTLDLIKPIGGESIKGNLKIEWEAESYRVHKTSILYNGYFSEDQEEWFHIGRLYDNYNIWQSLNWNTMFVKPGKYYLKLEATDGFETVVDSINETIEIVSSIDVPSSNTPSFDYNQFIVGLSLLTIFFIKKRKKLN